MCLICLEKVHRQPAPCMTLFGNKPNCWRNSLILVGQDAYMGLASLSLGIFLM